MNDLRNQVIAMNSLKNASKAYCFFYDETNNIAKLRLKEGALNVKEPVCFVLGGLVSNQTITLPDLDFFKTLLNLQKTINELKSEYLGKAGNLAYLGSYRTERFLDWFCAQGLFIHFQVIDPLYWGIIDIIDSAMDGMEIDHSYIIINRGTKADLHAVLQADIQAMELAFSKCTFPNVPEEKLQTLYNELIQIVDETTVIPHENAMMLKHILQRGLQLKGDTFLGGLEDNILLESLDKFYAERIMLFKNADHTFDNEERIVERLTSGSFDTILDSNTIRRFVDSKTEIGVQISDFIVSIWGRYFTWLNGTSFDELLAKLEALNPKQISNLRKLKTLMDRSYEESNGFFHYVASAHLIEKHRRVMIWIQ